ncbi:MAG: adenine deaminase, partial [Pseudomonadota bacterium]
RIVVPGFIDAHFHIESSLVTPAEFDRCVLSRGTTTGIWDPHEIANVLGREGLDYALASALETAMDLRVALSSCVPATDLETSGARLDVDDLTPLMDHDRVIGLAEFMNFPGVLMRDEGVLAKLSAFSAGHIDGHAPLLGGRDLNAYAAAGVRTDHETTTAAEAMEKLRKGMRVFIREGSVSKDLAALAEIIAPETSPYLAFCTDDRNPLDIADEGHIDFLIRDAIRRGAPVHHTYRAASWSAAQAFGLRDRGLVAPGWRADLVLLDDLESCAVSQVISAGRIVDDALFARRGTVEPVGLASVKRALVAPEIFRVPATGTTAHVIGVTPGRIITEHLTLDLDPRAGEYDADPEADLAKVAVLARHGINENVGAALVRGFGLERGAIASSVGHDSHNITVVGVDDGDMAVAVNRVIAMQGGFAVASGGEVRAELSLTLAGLMSLARFEDVEAGLRPLRAAARDLGCRLPEPFLQVSFLPLPVIPHLKITDRGLVDVDRFAFV